MASLQVSSFSKANAMFLFRIGAVILGCCGWATWSLAEVGNENEIDWEARFREEMLHAEQGRADAQYFVGLAFLSGRGVEQDEKLGMAWLERAAAHGFAAAFFTLGNYAESRGEYAEAFELYKSAAELGHLHGKFNVGAYYAKGQGVELNDEAARSWLLEAAEDGHMLAAFFVGTMFRDGLGGEKDLAKAVGWWARAAEAGVVEAQYELAHAYHYGSGIDQDMEKGLHWLREAALRNHLDAQSTLGYILLKGAGVPKNYAEGLAWHAFAEAQREERATPEAIILRKMDELPIEEVVEAREKIREIRNRMEELSTGN